MGVITVQGAVWDGDRARPGRVTVGADGVIEELLPEDPLPSVEVITGAWVGPALVDAHVHLAFGGPEEVLAGGVGAVRDLGAPLGRALGWRQPSGSPVVAVAGEIVTTPGGYPTTSWGADGFGRPVNGPRSAAEAVRLLAEAGVDVVKVALEPGGGLTVLDLPTTRAIVTAAHAAGLSVTCHALTAPMVARALDAGVDELAHTPVEPLPTAVVERMARARTTVVSTLETLIAGGAGDSVMANAKAFVRAGVRLVYGTDLGNTGTRPGASSAELARLAAAGLGRDGALRAATYGSAQVAGLAGRVDVDVIPGARTVLAVLPADPVEDPSAWDTPIAVVAGGRVVGGTAAVGRA